MPPWKGTTHQGLWREIVLQWTCSILSYLSTILWLKAGIYQMSHGVAMHSFLEDLQIVHMSPPQKKKISSNK